MMKRYSFLLFLFLLASYCAAQVTFRKAYGTSVGQTLPHPSGGFISVSSDGLLRTSATGNVLWAKSFGTNFYPQSLDFTPGGYIISGQVIITMMSVGALIKTDTAGNVIWGKELLRPNGGYYLPTRIHTTSDGGAVFTGQYGGDGFVTKTDANGDTLWTRLLPFPDYAWGGIQGANVLELPNGGYACSGYILTNAGYDPWLARFDANGDTLWTHVYDSQVQGSNEGNFHPLPDGGFMVMCGSDNGRLHIRTDSLGIPVWAKSYGVPGQAGDATAAMVIANNTYVFSGFTHTQSVNGSAQPILFSTDTAGNTVNWAYVYNLDSSGAKYFARDLRRTPDGGFVFGSGGLKGMVKTNSFGIAGCSYDSLVSQITNETITVLSGSTVLHTNQSTPYTFNTTVPSLSVTVFCENPGNVKGIEENELHAFSIAPNPADENVTLHFAEQHPAGELVLTNMTGQLIFHETIAENKEEFSLNTSRLPAGCYFLRIGGVAAPLIIVHP